MEKDIYRMNMGVMSESDLEKIQSSKIAIIGLGGLGGNLANLLVRLGVIHLTLIDFDTYEVSNLNRQLFSNQTELGKYKVDVIKNELLKINTMCKIKIIKKRIEETTLDQVDYLIDAVDSPKTKIYISDICTSRNIPLLHGSCAGWYGQVGWILPGSTLIKDMYEKKEFGLEESLFNPSFTPSAVASVMCAEFLKMIQNSDETTINELLLIDLENNSLIKTKRVK